MVWALPISLAATFGIDVSFSSSGYLDVSVHRVPSVYLWIQYTVTEVFSAGFPHSEISGSLDMCSSPKLFAAYHVFRRLSVPRHPPCALSCLSLSHDSLYGFVMIHLPSVGDWDRFVTLFVYLEDKRPRMSFLLILLIFGIRFSRCELSTVC